MRHLETVEQAATWLRERAGAAQLHTDSRRVTAGDAFIAWPGAATDGRQYVAGALQAGASACLVEAQGVSAFDWGDAEVASFDGLKAACGWIADRYFGHPSQSLEMLAVTGTNGKTSTAWWLAQAISALRKREHSAQYACGLIGTLGIGTPGSLVTTGLTTPDPVMLQAELARLRDTGASACVMEASSIGLAEQRMAGTEISVAMFTNFTQDHLDYHGSMEAYWLAKRALFDMPGIQAAVINLDDPKGDELVAYCRGRGLAVITTSQLRADASLHGSLPRYSSTGMVFDVRRGLQMHSVRCPVVGDYNAANMLTVLGALTALDAPFEGACKALTACTAVPGRMEQIHVPAQPLMVVDYAHTPDAIEKALNALRPAAQARGGKLWCVFGCGGDRDPSKRAPMAQAAQRAADQVVVTSDNPRHEAPQAIAAQIMAGLKDEPGRSAHFEIDRAKAIDWAAQQSSANDVILIAGKGHEDYQDIAGIKHPFSDRQHAVASLNRRAGGTRV
jgi:UDP-N-acetylmuramyl-tripeptide synthetase